MLQISQWPRQRKVDNAFYILKKQLRKDTERENKKKIIQNQSLNKNQATRYISGLMQFHTSRHFERATECVEGVKITRHLYLLNRNFYWEIQDGFTIPFYGIICGAIAARTVQIYFVKLIKLNNNIGLTDPGLALWLNWGLLIMQNVKFFIKYFFSKHNQISWGFGHIYWRDT